jgi:pimeloyl-ACP methyl ester carboxylesterase
MRPLLPLVVFPMLLAGCYAGPPLLAPPRLVTIDHYVPVKSTAPGLGGQESKLYVREVSMEGAPSPIPSAERVVLFVHGAGTPAEVTYDIPYRDFSWMRYLATAGFETYSLSLTGYGRSTRPAAMNDACNVLKAQQAQLVPSKIPAACPPTYPSALSTMESDWGEIAAVVDHLRKTRAVDRVSIVGWSQGGPRAAGYAVRNPHKVSRLFVLAPAYARDGPANAPNPLPGTQGSVNVLTREGLTKGWDSQVGCADQYDAGTFDAVWSELMLSDPAGAQWSPAVRRAPIVPTYGFNKAVVANMITPFAMVTGTHDNQVVPARVHALYEDLGSQDKVLVDLACSSHNAMWEKNHRLLFEASLTWLRDGKIAGVRNGQLKLGY